ncbi:MAG: GGDEF domain-containing protein [Deltaproteobacteria bacterium]|nr:GGDEF domain-containing protein [Deltaproteobacteria bacterium]
MLLIFGVVEFSTMWVLGAVERFPPLTGALIDTALLTLVSAPLIHIWVIKPFIHARDQALEQIRHTANTDPLTQLANRRFLSTQPTHANSALLLLDLDGFKPINDTHGHDAGDAVLVEIARRISSLVRAGDLAVRMGGDEFLIVIRGLEPAHASENTLLIANKLIAAVSEPLRFGEQSLRVGGSVGARVITSAAQPFSEALTEADRALYQAKNAGRGRVVLFSSRSE